MKLAGHPTLSESEARTRDRIAQVVLRRGPVTVAEIADQLSLTAAGVRRHLDQLQADGLVTTWESGSQAPRGRGRPARTFVLTDAGHAALATGYGELAASALRHLAEVGGPDAVRRFAEERVAELELRHRVAVEAAGESPARRAEALAEALSTDGYAATTRPAPAPSGQAAPLGVQLCQGHCPVQEVARQFPQLCEAETDAFSRLLGVHVQRLATLAHGEHVCTTYVPDPSGFGSAPRGHLPPADPPTTEPVSRQIRATTERQSR
ncbi:MAG: helix-turn-helix domain-containing protein [Kineosporiaceae bacterium]|nr:helix-turn-helix domain-containing protein [Kineosporiaceae bacterium]